MAISQNKKQQNQEGSPGTEPGELSGAHYPLSENKRLGKCDNGQRPDSSGENRATGPIGSMRIKIG